MNDGPSTSSLAHPHASQMDSPYSVTLATIPERVYKVPRNRGAHTWRRQWGIPFPPTERWIVDLVVNEKFGRYVHPKSLTIEFRSGDTLQRTETVSEAALLSLIKYPVSRFAPQPQIYHLRRNVFEFANLGIDRMTFDLQGIDRAGQPVLATIDVPIETYKPKNDLIFPVRGNFIVRGGHDLHELGHTYEWSQHFAYDLVCLGPNFELGSGGTLDRSQDYVAFGECEILAPADGTVIFARNDVPDDRLPAEYLEMPNPLWAIGGNIILIDHGGGERSLLAHMRHGSVRVKAGDIVKQGQVVGLMGSSGSPGNTHLHYQLQAGTKLFEGDGLPSVFKNVRQVGHRNDPAPTPEPGIYYRAE